MERCLQTEHHNWDVRVPIDRFQITTIYPYIIEFELPVVCRDCKLDAIGVFSLHYVRDEDDEERVEVHPLDLGRVDSVASSVPIGERDKATDNTVLGKVRIGEVQTRLEP